MYLLSNPLAVRVKTANYFIEVVIMAARLTDKLKKKIIVDYQETGSFRATGKKNGVSADTVRRHKKGRKTPKIFLPIWKATKKLFVKL